MARQMQCPRGFTLVELLVALAVMALLAVLSWRGLDGMTRAQAQTSTRADDVLALQAGLAQWAADLDAMETTSVVAPIDWDGTVLRLTRRPPLAEDGGVRVVAWALRATDGAGQWLRWQSPPLRRRGELQDAWARAAQWAHNPGTDERQREVIVLPLAQWQIFYFLNGAWNTPQPGSGTAAAAAPAAVTTAVTVPDGVRLVLQLPPGGAVSGTLTRDWARPTLGGGKS